MKKQEFSGKKEKIDNMLIKGGYPFYGEAIGIMLNSTTYPLIPGNVGNASTYSFPVRMVSTPDLPTDWWCDSRGADKDRLGKVVETAKKLEAEGVRAITTGCGFYAIFQKEVAEAVKIPFFSSPLLMVPIIHRILGEKGRIGIITAGATAGAKNLDARYLDAVGIDSKKIPLGIVGMMEYDEFRQVIMEESKKEADINFMESEVLDAVKKLLQKYPDTEALVFECSDLPPFSKAVQDLTGLPVFDFITMINWVYTAVVQRKYHGFM
jgi:aspartate/glutamate racemase